MYLCDLKCNNRREKCNNIYIKGDRRPICYKPLTCGGQKYQALKGITNPNKQLKDYAQLNKFGQDDIRRIMVSKKTDLSKKFFMNHRMSKNQFRKNHRYPESNLDSADKESIII